MCTTIVMTVSAMVMATTLIMGATRIIGEITIGRPSAHSAGRLFGLVSRYIDASRDLFWI